MLELRVRREQLSPIADEQRFVNCLEGEGGLVMTTQLILESELSSLSEALLQQ